MKTASAVARAVVFVVPYDGGSAAMAAKCAHPFRAGAARARLAEALDRLAAG